ncbi:MAG TPA: AAA family ATPase [Candidatus Scybalocola faecavium]|nr:AAA family ATPase [Candidatus Scybalocola faecavium]
MAKEFRIINELKDDELELDPTNTSKYSLYRAPWDAIDDKEYYNPTAKDPDRIWITEKKTFDQQTCVCILLYFLCGIGKNKENGSLTTIYEKLPTEFKADIKKIAGKSKLNMDAPWEDKGKETDWTSSTGFPFYGKEEGLPEDIKNYSSENIENYSKKNRVYLNNQNQKKSVFNIFFRECFNNKGLYLENKYQYVLCWDREYIARNQNNTQDITSETDEYYNQIKNMINNGSRQIILTGAPGTGKTRTAKKIAEDLGTELLRDNRSAKYEFIQFHPSYDYTDFIEGLRPIQGKKGKIEFKKIDGIFKRFCRKVIESENKESDKFFFIIDEINRADLSKVFGELMYCLEKDKRGEKNTVQTQYQYLPTYDPDTGDKVPNDVFASGFYIPENVIIIGTMNDIDRSVESMDFALRRRFDWLEMEVTEDLLKSALKMIFKEYGINSAMIDDIASRIMNLNEEVSKSEMFLNEQYYISQGYFSNLNKTTIDKLNNGSVQKATAVTEFLKDVYKYRLEGLLKEYMRGEDSKKICDFFKKCKAALLKEGDESPKTDAQNTDVQNATIMEDQNDE